MNSVFQFIADFFQAIFKGMAAIGWGFNMILIIIGFIAFFGWIYYMSKQKEVEKWD